MVDPITTTFGGALAKSGVELATRGALKGWRRVARYFSPTILIAGPHNAGKTTLSEYFRLGKFPPKEETKDETQGFEGRLVELVFNRESRPTTTATFWIRDSRGFFDADPLVIDVEYTRPVFIFFVFDVRKIDDGTGSQSMKFEFVEQWTEQFLQRVLEHIAINSKAKARLCGAAVLINKCDMVDEATLRSKQTLFEQRVKPHFKSLQPLLGFGNKNLEVFYTSMMDGRTLPRPQRPESDFPLAIDFMEKMLSNGGVIT